jgi:transposase InsO family protein
MSAVPIPQQDAETIAREFVANIVLKMGAPGQVLTDSGANFLSDLFKNTCRLLKIKKLQTTAFRPESNGSLERSHRVLGEYL